MTSRERAEAVAADLDLYDGATEGQVHAFVGRIAAALDEARREALEEAARVAEVWKGAGKPIAAEIRSLKSPRKPADTPGDDR